MLENKGKPTTIDEYIAQCQPEVRPVLEKIRATVKEEAPQAVEKISYGMPGFYQNGMLVWFAAHERHIGFYPTGEAIEAFKDEIGGYKWSKGAVQFPLDQAIPYDLVRRIVRYRVEQNAKKRNNA
jgi:uncharacterized protein YdhG (YjbR/CyaY superfamily)